MKNNDDPVDLQKIPKTTLTGPRFTHTLPSIPKNIQKYPIQLFLELK
jgi:hypothetical protein